MKARPANALLNLFAFSLLFFALYLNFLKKDDQGLFMEKSLTASIKESKVKLVMPVNNAADHANQHESNDQ